jgi:hypothetical protein
MSDPGKGAAPARAEGQVLAWTAALAVLTAIYSAWPVWRALFPLEIDLDEPWNAFQAQIVLEGGPLYPDARSLIVNNYPPLSFYATSALARLGLDPADAGRLLSLAATVVTALAAGAGVRLLGGSRIGATVAGLWFMATCARFFDGYVGKNDPHLPATAIALVALTWFLHRAARGRAVEPAIVLMVVAGFYKHSLLATPATALLWLALKDWRLSLRAALVGVAAAAAGLALCVAAYGQDFISQLLFYAREHSLERALGGLGQLQWVAPALIVCLVWWWHDRDTEAARFTRLFVAVAFVVHFLQKFGQGVGVNAQFELVAATAIGLGLAFDRIAAVPWVQRRGAGRAQAVVLAVLIIRLLVSTRNEPYLTVFSPQFRAGFDANSAVMAREVERVRSLPGPVACTVPTVCRLAGKAFVYDDFAMDQRVNTGKLTAAELTARLQAQGIRREVIDPRANVQALYRRN